MTEKQLCVPNYTVCQTVMGHMRRTVSPSITETTWGFACVHEHTANTLEAAADKQLLGWTNARHSSEGDHTHMRLHAPG